MRDISTAMLVMELFNRTQLYLSEPDPQYDTALDDIHSQSDEVFIQFAKSLFAAHRAMIAASTHRAAETSKERFIESMEMK